MCSINKETTTRNQISHKTFPGSGMVCVVIVALLLWACPAARDNDALKKDEWGVPVSVVPEDKPLVFPFDAGKKIWDLASISDRDETRIEFPNLTWFKGHFYCSFREGEIHGNHITGRGRVIRSADGVNWETIALFESATGDVRDPRLSVTSDGQLMVNTSIAFIEEVAPYQIIDGQELRRQSATWLSDDGENWSELNSCPTGMNTWRWDVAWHDGFGYSIGYSGKDPDGTLYRTGEGKTWQVVKKNMFPGGHGNEAALTFGHDGTLYVLLRGGLDAHLALGFARPPYDRDWQWHELDAYWDGLVDLQPARDVMNNRDLGGPNIMTLEDGRLLGAGRVNSEVRANFFLIDPLETVLTRIVGVRNGGSYPGMVEHEGDIWLTCTDMRSEAVYINRIRLQGR